MRFENMRYQEGIFIDRIRVRIGVVGISGGAGATFTASALDYYLNIKDAPRVFLSRNDRYSVVDSPEDMDDLDLIVGVIDPLPSKLQEGASAYASLKEKQNVIWLLNKDNPGVDHRELRRFLELKDYFSQDAISYEEICRAEYNCIEAAKRLDLAGLKRLADHIRGSWSEKCE